MGIERFFDKTLTQNRKTSGSDAPVEPWALIATFKGCIFPVGAVDSATQSVYIKLKVTHKMYCPMSPVFKIGDQIVDEALNEYIIKKKPNWGKFQDVLLSEVK